MIFDWNSDFIEEQLTSLGTKERAALECSLVLNPNTKIIRKQTVVQFGFVDGEEYQHYLKIAIERARIEFAKHNITSIKDLDFPTLGRSCDSRTNPSKGPPKPPKPKVEKPKGEKRIRKKITKPEVTRTPRQQANLEKCNAYYHSHKDDPEFITKNRDTANAYYHSHKDDPEFIAKNRANAAAWNANQKAEVSS